MTAADPGRGGPGVERLPGIALLPGFVSAHSHAFQRGLRGQGERFPAGAGSFWTWREAMYGLVETLSPERLFDLSLLAFREMRAAGITLVGEFHYLHHSGAGPDFRQLRIPWPACSKSVWSPSRRSCPDPSL